MGNCCSNQTIDDNGNITTPPNDHLNKRMTASQLAMLIKV